MRVIMTGGGTGGHIYPAIAIADKIREKHPEAEIIFVGTERGLEKILVPLAGYPIRFITVMGFNRKNLLKNIKVIADLRKGFKEARKIIEEFKPDIVIGTGGYVCGPIVKVAGAMGIRAFTHEQNAYPGLTNKLLEKHTVKVFTGFKETGEAFKNQKKIICSGNPIRECFYSADKKTARKRLGFADGDFVVVSFGGSRGAMKINEVMAEAAAVFSGIEGISLVFCAGKGYYDIIQKKLEEKSVGLKGNISVLPYIDEMDQYLAACDIVISRAGALAVSEIIALRKPAILIPSPNVTGNHQYYNGLALAESGGAILIEEKDLAADDLISTLLKMKRDPEILDKMKAADWPIGSRKAADIIYDNLGIEEKE